VKFVAEKAKYTHQHSRGGPPERQREEKQVKEVFDIE
jgi:hypothetical protein